MKKYGMLLVFMWTFSVLAQQKLTPVSEGSNVHFTIRNFGLSTDGHFSGIKGAIFFDRNKPALSSFDITLEVSGIDTDNSKRDKHLLSADYFDVSRYPTIRIKGKPVLDKNGSYIFEGTLTIKNITRPISFPFTVKSQLSGYLFEGGFKINRRSYQVGNRSAILSDDVKVSLKVLTK